MKNETANLRIFRYEPDKGLPWYQEYNIPIEEGLTVQKALFYIELNYVDPPAFRPYMCNRGQCACCVLTINGKTRRACTTQIKNNMIIEPLYQYYPVIRDLVVDFGRKMYQPKAGYIKLFEGTMIFRPHSKMKVSSGSGKIIHFSVINPLKCEECETKDCINACPVNQMENLDDKYGKRLLPKEITIKSSDNLILLNGPCSYCLNRDCLNSCPTGAIQIRNGLVMGINSKVCIGCGICMDACPYERIWMNIERGYAVKCDLCKGKPKCLNSCQFNNIEFKISTI